MRVANMSLIRNNTLVLLSLIFLITSSLVSGRDKGLKEYSNGPVTDLLLHEEEDLGTTKMRMLLKVEAAVLDYDDTEPNPRHDPRRKKPNP